MAAAAATTRFSVGPEVLDRLGAAMKPIDGDDVFNMVKDAKVVLVGESRHAHAQSPFARRPIDKSPPRAATAPMSSTVRCASLRSSARAISLTRDAPGWRCKLSMRLIQEAGFSGVCLEGDWPDTFALHSYVTCAEPQQTLDGAFEALKSRFPVWMWRNEPVRHY